MEMEEMPSQPVARSSRESFEKIEEELKNTDASIEAADLFDDENGVNKETAKKKDLVQKQDVLMGQARDEADFINAAVNRGEIKNMEKLSAFKNPDALLDRLQEGGENKPESDMKKSTQAEGIKKEISAQAEADAKKTEAILKNIQEIPIEIPKAKPSITATESIRLQEIDYRAPSLRGSSINTVDFSEKAIKDVSRGTLRYERNKGLTSEGQGEISLEKSQELIPLLKEVEDKLSQEAFKYVRLFDSAWRREDVKNLSLDNVYGFEAALFAKNMENQDVHKSMVKGFVKAVLPTVLVIMGIEAMKGVAVAGVIGIGGTALVAGAAGSGALLLAKMVYDFYKMKKAEKNFMSAAVAKKARLGFLSCFGKET